MLRARIFLPVLFLAMLMLVSCAYNASFISNATKTLEIGASIYESGYPAFLELHKKGIISDSQKEKGYSLALKYWAAYHAAQKALLAYEEATSAENKDKVSLAMENAANCLLAFSEYIQPFLKGDN